MSKKILVADAHPIVRNLIESVLKKQDYEVLLAEDGVKTMRIATQDKPDLILLDNSIPRLAGEQVCRKLKQSLGLKDIPVIMFLSKDEINQEQELRAIGVDAFVIKPFILNELLKQVENLLSKKKASLSDKMDVAVEDLLVEKADTKEGKKTQKAVTPIQDNEKGDGRLDIIEASALMENFELSIPAVEGGVHGFEWFLSELQKETQEDKKIDSHPEEKPILSENKIQGKSAQAIVSDTGKTPLVRDSTLEKIGRSELDQLFSELKEKISEKIVQEVAKRITPEFVEKIIREEMVKIAKDSS